MDKLELCIRQYGQSSHRYADWGIIVGDVCLLPEFGFPSVLLETLDGVFKNGLVNEYARIRDLKLFAKPRGYCGFDKERISARMLVSMFELCRQFYPQEIRSPLGEYWDELDIYRRAEFLDSVAFSSLIRNMFGYEGYPEGDEERAEKVERFISAIRPELFRDASDKIMLYCMVDDGNENCGFAPYIFVGKGCFLVVAQGWEL